MIYRSYLNARGECIYKIRLSVHHPIKLFFNRIFFRYLNSWKGSQPNSFERKATIRFSREFEVLRSWVRLDSIFSPNIYQVDILYSSRYLFNSPTRWLSFFAYFEIFLKGWWVCWVKIIQSMEDFILYGQQWTENYTIEVWLGCTKWPEVNC